MSETSSCPPGSVSWWEEVHQFTEQAWRNLPSTKPRCKTCKHWAPEDPKRFGAFIGSGECGKVPQMWDVTEECRTEAGSKPIQRLKKEHAAVLAIVDDSSQYEAWLVTMADFGCVQHETIKS